MTLETEKKEAKIDLCHSGHVGNDITTCPFFFFLKFCIAYFTIATFKIEYLTFKALKKLNLLKIIQKKDQILKFKMILILLCCNTLCHTGHVYYNITICMFIFFENKFLVATTTTTTSFLISFYLLV